MKIRFAPKAVADARRAKDWWRKHRRASPELFEQELLAAIELLQRAPNAGILYEHGALGAPVRRLLLPKTRNHVYYVVEEDTVVLVSIWGAPKGRGPALG